MSPRPHHPSPTARDVAGRYAEIPMLFDLTGTRHDTPMKTIKIDLTGFGVIGEGGTPLDAEGNPHEVSELFGRTLIHSQRAVEHDPENPVGGKKKKVPAGVQKGDPKTPTNGDPEKPAHGDPK